MRIGFYVNPVARLREHHTSGLPDPATAAALAESGGAHVILGGWSPNNGLLTERDVLLCRELVRGDFLLVVPQRVELVESVLKFHPDGVILVESGWDGIKQARPVVVEPESDALAGVIGAYRAADMNVSVLIEPNAQAVKSLARFNAGGVVLDCSIFSSARTEKDAGTALDRISDTALAAGKFGLVCAAGHCLTQLNVGPIARQRYVEELYFGQGIVARSLLVGLNAAVQETVTSVHFSRSQG